MRRVRQQEELGDEGWGVKAGRTAQTPFPFQPQPELERPPSPVVAIVCVEEVGGLAGAIKAGGRVSGTCRRQGGAGEALCIWCLSRRAALPPCSLQPSAFVSVAATERLQAHRCRSRTGWAQTAGASH